MFSYYERLLANVPRWSIAPRLKEQSVAEHSFYVALYVSKLARAMCLSNEKRLQILEAALRHDMVEAQTGDTPGPIKREIVDRAKLNNLERKFFSVLGSDYEFIDDPQIKDVIKAADLIDEFFWLSIEVGMGNRFLDHLRSKTMTRLNKAVTRIGMAELFMELVEEASSMMRGIDFPINNEDLT